MNLTVEEPSGVERKGWPVTSGVPFAKGALADPGTVALFGPDGKELPLQTEVLAKWPDGSVRWLLLDFQVDLKPNGKRAFELRHGPGVTRAPVGQPIQVSEAKDGFTLSTGPLQLRRRGGLGNVLDHALLDLGGDGRFESVTPSPSSRGLLDLELLTPEQKLSMYDADAGPTTIAIEQNGPLRACVRIEGRHASQQGPVLRYVLRVHAFRGQPFLRIFYTFINDNQGALMAKLAALRLNLNGGPGMGAKPYGFVGAAPDKKTGGGLRRVFQRDENHYQLDVDEKASEAETTTGRAAGWAAIGGDRAGLAVGVREFWQNWPKAIQCMVGFHGRSEGILGTIRVGICPWFPKGPYDGKPLEEENRLYYPLRDGVHTFKVGVAKTHELWATYYKGEPDVKKLTAFFQAAEEPLLAVCEPAYVSATKAAGEFPPADPGKYGGYDAWLSRALDAHLARREREREYGMLNYGDWFGERKVNWGNLEYDLQHGLFIQYLRTGDRRFFARAEQAARHHIDVDVVHATNPHLKNPWGRPPEAGDIWLHALNHTGGYFDEKTSGLPVDRTYHMGHSTNYGHVWISGDLDYYYLTGDRRAREVALMVADTMARHCPTAYSDHIRGLGWPIILVLAAYDATLDKKYLDAATKCWEVLKKNFDWQKGWVVRLAKGHCLHDDRRCYGNVPFMTGLTLCALARYHRVTADPEVLKAISVGIDQMIRECWMEDAKAFRYTPCPLTKPTPYTTLAAEAMAYEIALTGNKEHLRILREGLRAAIPKGAGQDHGKSLAQLIHFTPHALAALEE
ncbi:MAG: hypothetical protein FJ291_17505 [Planctomycetes bacterium]|nr:hypothetical protein [Planctomycetota bacterium]